MPPACQNELAVGPTDKNPPFPEKRGISSLSKKLIVGAIIDRPQILPKQNLSPQGENTLIFLRKIRKTAFFGGRSMIAPTEFSEI